MAEDVPPPACLLAPLRKPPMRLMGAGPSDAHPRVLVASALPVMYHVHHDIYKVMDEIKAGLQYTFQTANAVTMCLSASGSGATDAALLNLLEPGDVVVVGICGFWGERAAEMATRQGAKVVRLEPPIGEPVSLETAEETVALHRPRLLILCHVESGSCVLQPLEGFGPMCHKYGTLLMVDAVASMGGTPLYTDRWQLDVVLAASQKVLNAPPGLAPITFSPRAMKQIESREKPFRLLYWDILDLGDYWGCFGRPRKYHHTAPTTLLVSLREALSLVAAEGLPAAWRRHEAAAERLRAAMPRLGLAPFPAEPRHRTALITGIVLPPGHSPAAVVDAAIARHHVQLSYGLGPVEGKILRIGLLGANASDEAVDNVLRVLEDVLAHPDSVDGTPSN